MPFKEHTFARFDDVLSSIRSHVLEMCELVELQLNQSLQAYFESSASGAHRIIDQDYLVNQMEVLIDELCVKAIALQQPTASDLRTIIIASKIIVHLERIGDEAKKIARITIRLAHRQQLQKRCSALIRRAAATTQQNLAQAVANYASTDVNAATSMLGAEDTNIEEFGTIFRELIQLMTEDPRTISSSLEIFFVAKAIERIDNHIQQISKMIIVASSRYS